MTDEGPVTPLRTLGDGDGWQPTTTVATVGSLVATDGSSIRDGSAIRSYEEAADGDLPPPKVLQTSETILATAVDAQHQEVYLASSNGVSVYALGALALDRSAPALLATGLAILGDELFAVQGAQIVSIYDRSLSNSAPERSISWDPANGSAGEIVTDEENQELYIATDLTVLVVDALTSGLATPKRMLGNVSTRFVGGFASERIAVDPAHNEIFLLDASGLAVFDRLADGPAPTPLRTISNAWFVSASDIAVCR